MFLPSSSIHFNEAKAGGYRPLTRAFYLPAQRAMLDKFQAELKGVDFVLVGPATAPEIWRRGMVDLSESNCIPIDRDPRGTSRPLAV